MYTRSKSQRFFAVTATAHAIVALSVIATMGMLMWPLTGGGLVA